MLLNDITMNNKQADTKRRKISINSRMISILLITVFIVACVFLMFIYEADFPNLSTSGAVAAIVSAAISVLLTASVTSELIKSQTDTEEIKERNIRIFEKKITIYQNFLEKLHEIISKIHMMKMFPQVFFQEFYSLGFYIKAFNQFSVDFCV